MTHTEYARRYKCSIAQSIADRDWPLTESECIAAFKQETGRSPSDSEVEEMRPDREIHVQAARKEFDAMASNF